MLQKGFFKGDVDTYTGKDIDIDVKIDIDIGVDVHMDLASDMAVCINWGPFKGVPGSFNGVWD